MYLTTRGIILRKELVGECDIDFIVLTYDRGKVRMRARGARKLNAKIARHLDHGTVATFELKKTGSINLCIGSSDPQVVITTRTYTHYEAAVVLLRLAEALAPHDAPEPSLANVLEKALATLVISQATRAADLLPYHIRALVAQAGWSAPQNLTTSRALFAWLELQVQTPFNFMVSYQTL